MRPIVDCRKLHASSCDVGLSSPAAGNCGRPIGVIASFEFAVVNGRAVIQRKIVLVTMQSEVQRYNLNISVLSCSRYCNDICRIIRTRFYIISDYKYFI